MASVVANASNTIGQEKASRNKRKFRADTPLLDLNKSVSSPQNECPTYEFSAAKFDLPLIDGQTGACDMFTVNQDHSDSLKLNLGLSNAVKPSVSRPREEVEVDEFRDADWNDLTEAQLEELVLSNLDTIFKSAIKKIIACGYTEEVAVKAVLRSGLCYGCKDTVSNIVDNTLAFLRNVQEIDDSSREHCFEDLEQLEKYILAELVCVLRAVRPFFSTGDAMWCLLICDMNVSHACAMNGDPLSGYVDEVAKQRKPDVKCADFPNSYKPAIPIQCTHCVKPDISSKLCAPNIIKAKNSIVFSGNVTQKVSPNSTHEVKFGTSRKVHAISSKRYSILRQKSLCLEKSYRTYCCKGSSSRAGKLGGISGLISDKKLKSVSDTACINLKTASLRIHKEARVDSPPQDHREIEHSGTIVALPKAATSPAFHSVDNQPALVSPVDSELSLSPPAKCIASPVPAIDNAHGKTIEKWVPQDKNDEMILKLAPRVKELQNQLQEWTEWANQKVMQAARRLSKDKAELKTLKQEKEEVERLRKEKQALEDNTMKKLSEMGKALGKASGQVERANCTVRRLQVENTGLRHEMECAKLQAAEATVSCQEVLKREKNTLMKLQSWEKQKTFLKEELASEKRKLARLLQELALTNDLYEQTEAKWKSEEKAKEELLVRATLVKKEKEQIEASTKSKEEELKSKAQTTLHKYKEDIQKLEREISKLRVKMDSSKIAALRSGINGSYQTPKEHSSHVTYISKIMEDFHKNLNNGGLKRDRECVMCLTEEMSVVFLPCAHQVVCKNCNELHEKQGMKDCPSCRSHIQRRLNVRYAR